MNQINILFVDIDGTLTTTKSGKPFKQSPDDIKLIYGAKKAITLFARRGYKIFGVSNQGGCDTINKATGKPYKMLSDAVAEMQNTLELFPKMDSILFCPDMEGTKCWVVDNNKEVTIISGVVPGYKYRKPDIGMVLKILDAQYFMTFGKSVILESPDYSELNSMFNRETSLFVSDRDEDKQCAEKAQIPFMWANDWHFKYGSF